MNGNRQILVVEDNPQNYELVEFLLEDAGYAVRGAADATELRRELALWSPPREADVILPDLVLMDIQLPGVDGMLLVSEIRALEDAEGLPVVALTAHAMRGDRERFIAAGFDGYISKPIDVATFVDQVEAYFDRVKRTRSPDERGSR